MIGETNEDFLKKIVKGVLRPDDYMVFTKDPLVGDFMKSGDWSWDLMIRWL